MKPGIHRQRLRFEVDFTQIPNAWMRDPNLSMKAKGLLVYLMGHEVGYVITLGQIERQMADGKAAIRSAIDELEQYGYLETHRTSDARGYNNGLAYLLQNPKCENPTLENPTLENRTAYREQNLIENKTSIENNLVSDANLEQAFNDFWAAYPRKTDKPLARKAFARISPDLWPEVIAGAVRHANDPNLPELKFVKHAKTWLNAEAWLNPPLPERKKTAEEKIADRERENAERLARYLAMEQENAEK